MLWVCRRQAWMSGETGGTCIIPISQKRKLRPRDITWLQVLKTFVTDPQWVMFIEWMTDGRIGKRGRLEWTHSDSWAGVSWPPDTSCTIHSSHKHLLSHSQARLWPSVQKERNVKQTLMWECDIRGQACRSGYFVGQWVLREFPGDVLKWRGTWQQQWGYEDMT